jgi:hypothetical protein
LPELLTTAAPTIGTTAPTNIQPAPALAPHAGRPTTASTRYDKWSTIAASPTITSASPTQTHGGRSARGL